MLIGFMFTTTILLALIWGMLGNILDELKNFNKPTTNKEDKEK